MKDEVATASGTALHFSAFCFLPSVAVVTVNYNSGAYIEPFLRSLRRVVYPGFQLIVVDCASSDGSDRQIEELWPDVTLIRSPENVGFTGGNNLAIQRAIAEGCSHVLFLNADTEVEPRLLDVLMERVGPRMLVVPRVELLGSGGLMDDTVGEFDWRRGVWSNWVHGKPCPPELQVEREVPMASLCCLLAPVSVFRHAGMLDERLFMYYEDFDFLRRAQSAGYRIRYVPETLVYHRKSAASGGDSPFKAYYATRNRAAVMRRHSTPGRFRAFSLDFAATRAVRVAQHIAQGRPDIARAMLRGWWDAARGRMGRTFPPPVPLARHSQVLDSPATQSPPSLKGRGPGG
jgi:GT2 family glycosyltransferase